VGLRGGHKIEEIVGLLNARPLLIHGSVLPTEGMVELDGVGQEVATPPPAVCTLAGAAGDPAPGRTERAMAARRPKFDVVREDEGAA
jgi:hypothetical protein